jgi:hypothetical protein
MNPVGEGALDPPAFRPSFPRDDSGHGPITDREGTCIGKYGAGEMEGAKQRKG